MTLPALLRTAMAANVTCQTRLPKWKAVALSQTTRPSLPSIIQLRLRGTETQLVFELRDGAGLLAR